MCSCSSHAGRPLTENSLMVSFCDAAMLLSFPRATSQGWESSFSLILTAASWFSRTVQTLKSVLTGSVCGSGAYGNLITKPSDGYEYSFNGADVGILDGCWANTAPASTHTTSSGLFMPNTVAASQPELDSTV